jgi:hypothetical protein
LSTFGGGGGASSSIWRQGKKSAENRTEFSGQSPFRYRTMADPCPLPQLEFAALYPELKFDKLLVECGPVSRKLAEYIGEIFEWPVNRCSVGFILLNCDLRRGFFWLECPPNNDNTDLADNKVILFGKDILLNRIVNRTIGKRHRILCCMNGGEVGFVNTQILFHIYTRLTKL